MTLYKLLKQISNIITPESDEFYRYALYTSDDNGFLRTRHCWCFDRPVKDREIGDGFKTILVTSKQEINVNDLRNETDTLLKMQTTYSEKEATIEDAVWDIQLDYCFVYIFDLLDTTQSLR